VMPEPEPLPVEVPAALDPIEEPDPGDAHAGDGPDTPDTIAGMVDDPDLVVGGEEPALPDVIDEPTPQLADTTPDSVTPVEPSGSPFPAAEDAVGPLANPVVLGGVGLAVVGLVAFFVMRRRRAAGGGDPMADSIHEMPGGETVDVGSTRIPAGGFSMEDARESEAPLGGPSTEDSPFATPDVPSHDGPTAPVPRPANVVSIFEQDQSANQGDSPMSDVMSDLPANPASAPVSAAPPGGSAGGGVAQMMEAMERRMGDLESRLEAANEAREKLERQVAAQAEELRVQRAAIARTQRALRGMTRTGDDKATEPALREDTQARTRVTGA